jgi:hypothetical protein
LRNRLPGRIRANCSSPNRLSFGHPPVDVQRHDVGLGQQLVERAAATGVAERQLVGRVVEQHRHAERLGQHGQLAADVAVADDAEPPAADLVAADGGLVPPPGVHVVVLDGQPAGQRDDLGQRQLDDAAGVAERRVEDAHPALGGGGQVDLVGADAEGADREQVRSGVEDLGGDRGVGADAEQPHPGQPLGQLAGPERPVQPVDVVAGVLERPGGVGVDVLEQQGALGGGHGAPGAQWVQGGTHEATGGYGGGGVGRTTTGRPGA